MMKPTLSTFQAFTSPILDEAGLNCHAVFDLHRLPLELQDAIFNSYPEAKHYRQLLLFANGGPQFWHAFSAYRIQFADSVDNVDDPMDQYARAIVAAFLEENKLNHQFQFVYPGSYVLNLQSLGRLLGWHQDTPLKIGLHPLYGVWFAYRAAVLVNSDFPSTAWIDSSTTVSPCQTCASKACVVSCPAGAVTAAQYYLDQCLDYRTQENSPCAQRCISREACPVAPEYRYSDEQIRYHYKQSLTMLRKIKQP